MCKGHGVAVLYVGRALIGAEMVGGYADRDKAFDKRCEKEEKMMLMKQMGKANGEKKEK